MPYNNFSWSKVKQDFGLTTIENAPFLTNVAPVEPSLLLQQQLERNVPWASTGNEKARSEALINPVLLEVRALLQQQISVFSGERFDVSPSQDLAGYVDFLISKSPEQVTIEAPVVVIVEAKQGSIREGLGQCAATMVAVQQFNLNQGQTSPIVFGCVSTGTLWRFLKLEKQQLTLDTVDYTIPPANQVIGIFNWLLR